MSNNRNFFAALKDDDLRERYCTGLCGVLAVELKKLTGWPIYTLNVRSNMEQIAHRNRAHALVMDADGFVYDAWGKSTQEAMITKYRGYHKSGSPIITIDLWDDPYKENPFPRDESYHELCREDHIKRMLPELHAKYQLENA